MLKVNMDAVVNEYVLREVERGEHRRLVGVDVYLLALSVIKQMVATKAVRLQYDQDRAILMLWARPALRARWRREFPELLPTVGSDERIEIEFSGVSWE